MRRLDLPRGPVEIRHLTRIEEMEQAVEVQRRAWEGRVQMVPASLLLTLAHEGGVVLGAAALEEPQQPLVGFVFGFLARHHLPGRPPFDKHHSHMLGVVPEWQGQGLGYWLKRAQWQAVRHQALPLITWTFDPLWGRNAYLNITKLGGIARTYYRNRYGRMTDPLNRGLPSDRVLVEVWVHSRRVLERMRTQPRKRLDLAHFFAAGARILNPTRLNDAGWPEPPTTVTYPEPARERITLVEIPADWFGLKAADLDLALRWRLHLRAVLETLFDQGYIITEFLHLKGQPGRSFYALSHGESTLG